MRVTNRIEDCARVCNHRANTRTAHLLSRVALHRCTFANSEAPFYCADDSLDAIGLAARFAVTDRYAPGFYTKGTIPFTLLIKRNGRIEQLLPITAVASHALRWNVPAIGIALVGNMKEKPPTKAMWDAAVSLCAMWRGYGLRMYGHDELPFASSDTTKRCPGAFFVMSNFRREVRARAKFLKFDKETARVALEGIGLVF